MMLVSSSSLLKRVSTSPLQSLQARNFSTIQAAKPTGESFKPYARVSEMTALKNASRFTCLYFKVYPGRRTESALIWCLVRYLLQQCGGKAARASSLMRPGYSTHLPVYGIIGTIKTLFTKE